MLQNRPRAGKKWHVNSKFYCANIGNCTNIERKYPAAFGDSSIDTHCVGRMTEFSTESGSRNGSGSGNRVNVGHNEWQVGNFNTPDCQPLAAGFSLLCRPAIMSLSCFVLCVWCGLNSSCALSSFAVDVYNFTPKLIILTGLKVAALEQNRFM